MVWTGDEAHPSAESRFSSHLPDGSSRQMPCKRQRSVPKYFMDKGRGGPKGTDVPPGTFARWFLEQEMRASAGMGIASERAEYHLCRAIANLERGMLREALDDANTAAHLNAELRPRALIVARLCIQREMEDELPFTR
jgi:hypothetical protein